jgi:hypothetical protein
MNISKLNQDELDTFKIVHNILIPHRKKRFQTYDILHPTSAFADKNKKIYESINPILVKAVEILNQYNFSNYDINNYCIEFHQRNCGFEKKPYQWSTWHNDDYGAVHNRVYTILFYIRKDNTVKDGNLDYKLNKNKNIHTHIVTTGDILCFSGDLQHKPQKTSGFGCRDLIVLFIKRT